MPLNDSIMMFIEQAAEEIAVSQLSIIVKVLIIFGAIYLFNMVTKTGGSLIEILFHIFGLFKWIIYKIMKKDI